MRESSDKIRHEALKSCLFVMIIQSKNNRFVSKEKMFIPCMQKQTNSAPSVPPTLKFYPWNSERSVLSASTSTVILKNLLFE